jgi:hypothetical protein
MTNSKKRRWIKSQVARGNQAKGRRGGAVQVEAYGYFTGA